MIPCSTRCNSISVTTIAPDRETAVPYLTNCLLAPAQVHLSCWFDDLVRVPLSMSTVASFLPLSSPLSSIFQFAFTSLPHRVAHPTGQTTARGGFTSTSLSLWRGDPHAHSNMTYVNGAPDPSDARAYAPGGLVGHDTQVDLERQRQQLKFLQELHTSQQHHHQRQQQQSFQSQPRPVFQLPRGPVYWNPAPSSSNAGPAPVSRHYTTTTTKHQEDHERARQQHRAAGHVASSIHTILEIAMSSHRSSPTQSSPSVSAGLTTSRYSAKKSPESTATSSHHAGIIAGQERSRQSPSATISSSATLTAAPSSPPPLGTGSGGVFGGSGTPLRRGKWTKAEEEFAAATIKYFCGGLLNLQFGTLLRGFLAQQLHCHPMRISKKLLPGTTFCGVEISRKLGRRAYSPRWCDSPAATQQKLEAEDHLAALRTKFIASIEEEADELDDGLKSSPSRRDTRLSEASDDRQSRASTTGSPHSEMRSEVTPGVASPAVEHHQQPVYQHHQQVGGLKRPREDEQWAAAEQRHHSPHAQLHQPLYQPSHQQQHSYYSQRSYGTTSTSDERQEASSPPAAPRRTSSSQNWYLAPSPPPTLPPSAAAGAHGLSQASFYYENVHRAVKLPRLSYNPPPYAEPKPRASVTSSSSPPPPLLPSLRASLERASSYRDHQQNQQ